MHSCELMTNLRAKKVLSHHAEVAKDFRSCNLRLCFLQCDWRLENSPQRAILLMKPDGLVECHQTLSSLVGSGHESSQPPDCRLLC